MKIEDKKEKKNKNKKDYQHQTKENLDERTAQWCRRRHGDSNIVVDADAWLQYDAAYIDKKARTQPQVIGNFVWNSMKKKARVELDWAQIKIGWALPRLDSNWVHKNV